MLVLSRFQGEKIMIGEGADRIVITVVRIDGGKVRLGVDAPSGVGIWREEVAPQDDPRTRPENRPDTYGG